VVTGQTKVQGWRDQEYIREALPPVSSRQIMTRWWPFESRLGLQMDKIWALERVDLGALRPPTGGLLETRGR